MKEVTKIYDVEEIMSRKVKNGKAYYLVKWHGYGYEESTWEPREHVAHLTDMLKPFEAQQPTQSAPANPNNTKTTSKLQKNSKKIKKDTLLVQPKVRTRKTNKKAAAVAQTSEEMAITSFDTIALPVKEEEKEEPRVSFVAVDSPKETTKRISTPPRSDPEAHGSFERDEPLVVTRHVSIHYQGKKRANNLHGLRVMFFKVEWKSRKNGFIPESTWESSTILKEKCPRLLLDYYEKYGGLI